MKRLRNENILNDAEIRLLASIVQCAYNDLFSNNIQERTSAQLFFRDNPYNIPEYVMAEIEKQFNKDKKERETKYAKFKAD